MKRVLKWIGLSALALVAAVTLTAGVFWFTVPPTPTLSAEFEAAAPDSTVSEPALRAELLNMLALDQKVRESALEAGTPDMASLGGVWRVLQTGVQFWRVDGPNTERLKEIVAERGWPTRTEVGADGRRAVFFLVQHADGDLAFQKTALAPMREAYEAGDATGGQIALLTDRILKAEGQNQLYGSQLNTEPGKPAMLWPIEDEANVDARRAKLGMTPLAEYLAMVCAESGVCVER